MSDQSKTLIISPAIAIALDSFLGTEASAALIKMNLLSIDYFSSIFNSRWWL